MIAAPLKPILNVPPFSTVTGIPGSYDRGPIEAACGGGGDGGKGGAIPRSYDRGPIEAAYKASDQRKPLAIPRSYDRGPIEALLLGDGPRSGLIFRDLMIAAPLKR